MSIDKNKINKSPVFISLINKIQKDMKEELSIGDKSNMIDLIMGNNDKNALDEQQKTLLVDFFSNKIKIEIIQINEVVVRKSNNIQNKKLIKTNSKNNVFMINIENKDIIKEAKLITYDIKYVMNIVFEKRFIKSNKEVKILNQIANKGVNVYFDIIFDEIKGIYYKKKYSDEINILFKSETNMGIEKRIEEYKQKRDNKERFKKCLT